MEIIIGIVCLALGVVVAVVAMRSSDRKSVV